MEPNAFAVLLGPDAVPDLVKTTIRLIPGVDTVSAQADDDWRRLKDENEELRAEQEDDRRAWGRDSVAWELAVEGLKEENARLRGLLARTERVILKRYLDTGGIHVALLDDIRRALGLPGELTQEDRNLAVRPLVID